MYNLSQKWIPIKSDDDPHIVVKLVLNQIPERDFVEFIQGLSEEIGLGFQQEICTFPCELDPFEEKFDGVEFYIPKEAIVIGYKDFYDYVKQACNSYLLKHPEDTEILKVCLEKIRVRYELID